MISEMTEANIDECRRLLNLREDELEQKKDMFTSVLACIEEDEEEDMGRLNELFYELRACFYEVVEKLTTDKNDDVRKERSIHAFILFELSDRLVPESPKMFNLYELHQLLMDRKFDKMTGTLNVKQSKRFSVSKESVCEIKTELTNIGKNTHTIKRTRFCQE